MKKWVLILLSFCLLAACEEERTSIVLKDFTNTTGSDEVYITLSSNFFTPTYSNSIDLQTVIFPAAPTINITKDVVLLDVPAGEENGMYYIYILEDSDASGTILAGDQIMPVFQVKPESGESVEIKGIVNSFDYSYPLGPDFRLWVNWSTNLPVRPSETQPLYVQFQSGSGTFDCTAWIPSITTMLNNSAEVGELCFFLSNATFTYFAYLDMNGNGTPDSGDYASFLPVNAVTPNIFINSGDNSLTLGYSLVP